MKYLAICLVSFGTIAHADVDGERLAQRIVAAQNVIWPDEVFNVTFEGCKMTDAHISPGPYLSENEAIWWLADFDTDPSNLKISRQRMTDGTTEWISASVGFPLKDARAEEFADGIALYTAEWDRIDRMDIAASGGWLDWIWPSEPSEGHEAAIQTELREIYERRVAGDYGPLLQRNNGWAEGVDEVSGAYFHPYGLIDTSLGFSFRGDVLDGLLRDIHAYRLENCPADD